MVLLVVRSLDPGYESDVLTITNVSEPLNA